MQLRAGQLSITYENGFLRWIMAGESEVLRMIYFAVRDKNWGTVKGKVFNEQIDAQKDSFTITYETLFKQDKIQMHWLVSIVGSAESSIVFQIKGTALSTFQKNRTGFCVLHPIQECAGKAVLIKHADGTERMQSFPTYISPHQPFKNIGEMEWEANAGIGVKLSFDGEIFETEDHRNWTDNNFKTYCTPLDLPYPLTLEKGAIIEQQVTLQLATKNPLQKTTNKQQPIKITIGNEQFLLPKIGFGRAVNPGKFYKEALIELAASGFGHYRVDLHLSSPNWEQQVKDYLAEADLLKAKLEIAVFVSDEYISSIQSFATMIAEQRNMQQIILFEEKAKCISSPLLNKALKILRPLLPGVKLGGGTDIYFAELNRSSLNASSADFVSYSVNPQVHAYDDASVMENAFAQRDAVQSAIHKFKKPVYVSPVTLKMRYNADACESVTPATPLTDKRQSDAFAAAWNFASLKSLTEAGAASITYFESIGIRGLGRYSYSKGLQLYPAGSLLHYILSSKEQAFTGSQSTKPFSVCSIVLSKSQELLIANLTADEQLVELPKRMTQYSGRDLITKQQVAIEKSQYITLTGYQILILS